MILWAVLKWFSSSIFFAMAKANQWASRLSSQILDCLGIAALVPEVDVMVGLDLCHRQERIVFLLW